MNIGIPKERRPFEFRVGMSPAGVEILTQRGHQVYVEHEAGVGAGFSNQEYEKAGARVAYSADEVFGRADLLLKVARPTKEEIEWLRPGTTLAGFLHLASTRRDKVDLLLEKKITSVAYEQIEMADRSLPVLRPFSEIGGSMTPTIAARFLQCNRGGKGILLSGVPGVPPAEVVILGSGVAAIYAAKSFLGLGAHVTVLGIDLAGLQKMHERFPGIATMISSERNVEKATAYADVVVGAVHISGQRSPVLVSRKMVQNMKPRSVIVDLSIDLGGCVETSRPTTHELPVYVDEGVTHYCVPNMPSVVARTATHAFINAAMPYIINIADLGITAAIDGDPSLEKAINTHAGRQVHLKLLEEVEHGLD
jgi:alanine dehydrogenase